MQQRDVCSEDVILNTHEFALLDYAPEIKTKYMDY